MDRINPYAVVRNTATHEAYRARVRAIVAAGQPFSMVALICLCAWGPLLGVAAGRGMNSLLMGAVTALAFVGAVCAVIAAVRVNRYRRDHPIPEEWRQIPRVSWPPVPGRKPPLP